MMKPFSCFVFGIFITCLAVTLVNGTQVCYGNYGCFSNDPPFDRGYWYDYLPESPEVLNTVFYLYTRSDRIGFTTLDDNDANKLEESDYDGTKNTNLIIHGWQGRPLENEWVNDMKQAFLDKADVNVIIVGWREGASRLNYHQAVANTRLVGAQVAAFIKFLNEQTSNTAESFYLIGHSLGAHVSGYAGKRLHDLTNNKIARITGLDPASPGYNGEHVDVRLDATDADFVDVIHTDAAGYGTPEVSGHFDFRPNGGESQPGCITKKKRAKIMKKLKKKTKKVYADGYSLSCRHSRAQKYYIESISAISPAFVSYPCDNIEDFRRALCTSCTDGCPEMGYNAVNYRNLQSGNKYLMTFSQSPYKVARYVEITFQTGDTMYYANGDNPTVILYGADINSGEFQIDADLDPGSTEKFVGLLKRDPGALERIAIKNDQWTTGLDRWEVIKVQVKYLDDDITYTACYNMSVEGDFVEKPLTSGDTNCKRKHTVRNKLKKFHTGKKHAKKSKKVH